MLPLSHKVLRLFWETDEIFMDIDKLKKKKKKVEGFLMFHLDHSTAVQHIEFGKWKLSDALRACLRLIN